jgi:hypothetical protein
MRFARLLSVGVVAFSGGCAVHYRAYEGSATLQPAEAATPHTVEYGVCGRR